MSRFSDEDVKTITALKTIIASKCGMIFLPHPSIDTRRFFLAGGFFANLYHYYHSPARESFSEMFADSDMDIYVRTDTQEEYDAKMLPVYKAYQEELIETKENYASFADTVAIRKRYPDFVTKTVQFVHCRYGNPNEVVETFDMEHSKVYYDIFNDTLHISPAQFELIKDKKILLYEGKSLNRQSRLSKWERRGWTLYKTVEPEQNDNVPF